MKESYEEDLASHFDPESCVGRRKAADEALTGAHAGRVWSCEIRQFRRPTLLTGTEGNIEKGVTSRVLFDSCAVVDPEHVWKLLTRNPGDPRSVL